MKPNIGVYRTLRPDIVKKNNIIGFRLLQDLPGESIHAPITVVVGPARECQAIHSPFTQNIVQFWVGYAYGRPESGGGYTESMQKGLRCLDLPYEYSRTAQH